MKYESNPKHSEPWQRGRKGLLCPQWAKEKAQQLLDESVQVGNKRFATINGFVFVAQEHGTDVWHGYPEGWEKIDEKVRRQWQKEQKIRRRDIAKYWERESVEESLDRDSA